MNKTKIPYETLEEEIKYLRHSQSRLRQLITQKRSKLAHVNGQLKHTKTQLDAMRRRLGQLSDQVETTIKSKGW